MTKYIGLARVSTKRQLNKGNSLEDQMNSIKSYADKLGGEVSEIIQIQVSGSKMKLNSSVLQKVFITAKEEGSELSQESEQRVKNRKVLLVDWLTRKKQIRNQSKQETELFKIGKSKSGSRVKFKTLFIC